MNHASVRGMKDLLPPETLRWASLEESFRSCAARFGFAEVRTPLLEKTELFSRSVGEATDIVEKEMYTFTDRSGESLSLRPEGTASVVRALLANRAALPEWPVRLFYLGPMFRHERPQKGRLRQFHQLGAELFGSDSPYADAELLLFLHSFLAEAGIGNVSLQLNSLGDPDCRPAYTASLVAFLREREERLCEDCRRRIDRNPLRVLDCKSAGCAEAVADAPSILDVLCGPCRDHFDAVERTLRENGVPFARNPRMVRGLDYYRRTTFEFVIPGMGAQNTVAAGGRYDGLAEMLGGKERVPAIGFAIGLERLLMLLGEGGAAPPVPAAFVAVSSPAFLDRAFRIKASLAGRGLRVEMDYEGRSLKSQFRRADRSGAPVVLVLGEAEAERGVVAFKDMRKGTQEELTEEAALSRLLGEKEEG
jgi:histidyl-tRNA synthetase